MADAKIDCPVDKSLGIDDPNNVFTCNATQTCCTVKLLPACCSKMDTTTAIIMQLQLWGPLLLVIILLALFIWWCRTDEPCCDVEKPCLYRCGCKKEPKEDDDDAVPEVIKEDVRGSRQSLRSTKSSTTLLHDAEVDPTELEEVAVELDATPDGEEGEPVVAPPAEGGDEEEPAEGQEGEEEEKEEEKPGEEENKED